MRVKTWSTLPAQHLTHTWMCHSIITLVTHPDLLLLPQAHLPQQNQQLIAKTWHPRNLKATHHFSALLHLTNLHVPVGATDVQSDTQVPALQKAATLHQSRRVLVMQLTFHLINTKSTKHT